MKTITKIVNITLLVCLGLITSTANAVNFLYSAETSFFRPIPNQKYGIEVEMVNMSQQNVAQILIQNLGGTPSQFDNKTLVISNSKIGRIEVKVEVNETSDDKTIDWSNKSDQVIEVVTDPISYELINSLDIALEALHKSGAKGTEKSNPVSIQINYGMMQSGTPAEKTKDLLSILRNYFSPSHQLQIKNVLKIPDSRWPYLRNYSKGFMTKVFDPNYNPSAEDFYFDFFYRQSLELSSNGDQSAWVLSKDAVRQQIEKLDFPIHVQIIKLNQLKIASLLLYWFPQDHFSKVILKHGWVKAAPLIEYRNANNDFKVAEKVRQATGIYLSSKKYGYYNHDKLMSNLSGVSITDIQNLRNASETYKNKVYGYRYFPEAHNFADADGVYKNDIFPLYKKHPNLVLGFMPPMQIGQVPLNLPGESIVWHRYQLHAANIQGKYNPAMSNHLVSHLMENKWFEYIVWSEFAPGVLTHTELLQSLDHSSAESALSALNQKYPKGWILKGSWDWATEKNGIISSKMDTSKFFDKKALSDFLVFKSNLEKELTTSDPEEYFWRIKEHPGYITWKFSELLRQPEFVLVQPLLDIKKEFRVEMIGGKSLSKGTTIDRYFYEVEGNNGIASSEEAKAVESFANAAVAKLPSYLQKTPMAMDVALLSDGRFEVIETNPTGNGGFIAFKPESVEVMNDYLLQYSTARDSDKASVPGLTQVQQMALISRLFKKYSLDPKIQFPGFEFLQDGYTDARYKLTERVDFNLGFNDYRSEISKNVISINSLGAKHKSTIRSCEKLFAL